MTDIDKMKDKIQELLSLFRTRVDAGRCDDVSDKMDVNE